MTAEATAPPTVPISRLADHVGQDVTVRGWIRTIRSGGKIRFLVVRDGSADLQVVAARNDLPEADWEETAKATQETAIAVRGTVRAEARAVGGVELISRSFAILAPSVDFPITPKEHGTAFLMANRHLWLRSSLQHAILRVRSEVEFAIHDFFAKRDYVRIDSPILTPAACEGTSTLFETDYFGDRAFLSQSGQLYLEPAAAAFGKVYCFGPTFRAEKSKTRRHLTEFWMVEPEVAFLEFDGLQALAEEFVSEIVARVLDRRGEELKRLERDLSKLENIRAPFPRVRHADAVRILREKGFEIADDGDLGGDEETALAAAFDRPVMVTHYPASIKAFYMQPDPADPTKALALDMLAPEGYGEIIGGSQRIHDLDLLLRRIEEHALPREAYEWYLDVRRYGSVPHAGFGMGIERCVAWITGVKHLRECIPYPRMLYKIYP